MERPQLEKLHQRAYEEAERAQAELHRVEADLLRLDLLDFAADHGVQNFEFEKGSEYNDEGGYYDTANLTLDNDEEISDGTRDLLYDLEARHSTAAYQTLFGDEHGGELTVEQLRERG